MLSSSNEAIKLRIRVIASVLTIICILLIIRLYHIQVTRHEELLTKARRIYTTTQVMQGKRGEIFTREGHLLVGNRPSETVVGDPSLLLDDRKRRKAAFLLARTLNLDYQEVYRKLAPVTRPSKDKNGNVKLDKDGNVIRHVSQYALIKRNVPLNEANELRRKIAVNKLRGISIQENYQRYYPKGKMLSNILGFTSVDHDQIKAGGGLERTSDRALTATAGQETYERSRKGIPLFYGLYEEQAVRDGKNLYLTICEPLQAIMEEELDRAYAELNPQTIYAIMADPRTGDILAVAQRPTFDPNDRRTIVPDAYRARIAEDAFEPGSIIKPFTYAAAFDHDIVRPQDLVDCEGGRWVYLKKPLTDSHVADKIPYADALRFSSNIGTAKLALRMGPKLVDNNLRNFGFGRSTGLPLKPDRTGIFPDYRTWNGLTITRLPIGYAITATPLQMMRAYCALADHGNYRELRLIDRIVDPDTGETVETPHSRPVQLFRKPDTARTIVDILVGVTSAGGTATRAAIPGYRVAGKTGTSRKHIKDIGYVHGKYFASFVGFVPADDPAFVLLVTVDEPKGKIYGGSVSAPIFKAIATRALKHLNIPPTETKEQ